MIKNKNPMIRLFSSIGLIMAVVIINNSKYMTLQEKEEMLKHKEMGLFPKDMIQVKLNEIKRQEEFIKSIDDNKKEIARFIGSDEYKKREVIYNLRKQTGKKVVDYKEVNFILTAYSSLPEENGGYTITSNGEPLEGNIVANNIIPQGTNIILGERLVRVADKGSKSRFSVINRLDVLVERLPNESINTYRKRVSDYGIQKVTGYILKIN